jgi:sec-independent protein translocase protein TatA
MEVPELLIVLVIVGFVVFGAKRMPDAARGLGRSLRIFKAETKGLLTDDVPPAPLVAQPQQIAAPPAPVVAAPVADTIPVAPPAPVVTQVPTAQYHDAQ